MSLLFFVRVRTRRVVRVRILAKQIGFDASEKRESRLWWFLAGWLWQDGLFQMGVFEK